MKPNTKTILCIVFVFALQAGLTSLSVKPARAAGDLYVVPGGNDTNDCASPTTPCATIQGRVLARCWRRGCAPRTTAASCARSRRSISIGAR